jgi:hypothetical protein
MRQLQTLSRSPHPAKHYGARLALASEQSELASTHRASPPLRDASEGEMKDAPSNSGAPKPVDVEAVAREERRLCAELDTPGETTLEEVGQKTREWFEKVSELLLATASNKEPFRHRWPLVCGQ